LGIAERIVEWFYNKGGVKAVIKAIGFCFWFLFPFFGWFEIYSWLGVNYFNPLAAWLGLIFLIFWAIYCSYVFIRLRDFELGIKKRIDAVNSLYTDPSNSDYEQQVRRGMRGVFAPYLHIPFLYDLGIDSFYNSKNKRSAMLARSIEIFLHVYLGYSLVTFLILYKETIAGFFAYISPLWTSSNYTNDLLNFIIQNQIWALLTFFIISVVYSYFLFRGESKVYASAWYMFNDAISLTNRIYFAAMTIFAYPFALWDKDYVLKIDCYTFPQDTPLLIEKAVEEIQAVDDCKVLKWSNDITNTDEVVELKKAIVNTAKLPQLIRDQCIKADATKALESIKQCRMTIYYGLAENKCEVWGKITYNAKEKCFEALFIFESKKTKVYFDEILKSHMEEAKAIKPPLTNNIADLLKRYNIEVDGAKVNG
jgi:hypothetical protein